MRRVSGRTRVPGLTEARQRHIPTNHWIATALSCVFFPRVFVYHLTVSTNTVPEKQVIWACCAFSFLLLTPRCDGLTFPSAGIQLRLKGGPRRPLGGDLFMLRRLLPEGHAFGVPQAGENRICGSCLEICFVIHVPLCK